MLPEFTLYNSTPAVLKNIFGLFVSNNNVLSLPQARYQMRTSAIILPAGKYGSMFANVKSKLKGTATTLPVSASIKIHKNCGSKRYCKFQNTT